MNDTHNIQAEQSVIGAMLLSREAIFDVTDILAPGDFHQPAHETIYRTILAMHNQGQPVDAVTVTDALDREGELARVGGPATLHVMAGSVPTASSAGYYADIVAKTAIRRRLHTAGQKIMQLAEDGGDEETLVETARREVDQTTKATAGTFRSFGETIDDMLDTLDEAPDHRPSPWNALNDIIGGFRPGALYVVGARPSVGKSVAALQIAKGLTQSGAVAFSSLEMSQADVQMRAVSSDLRIDLRRLIERDLTPGDWNKIRDRRKAWSDVPLFIDDRSGVSITDIKRFARTVSRRKPLAALVVDYLQLMTQMPGDKRPRHEFVADCSRQLKILAMDMNIPVIALSQLNRASEQRQDKLPQLSDLRESGAVEQDSDVVILLHREIMGEKRGDLQMLVAKNRHGATNIAELTFWGHYSTILDPGAPFYPAGRAAA